MASNIPLFTQRIDINYPITGTDNSSNGFHVNFSQIKLALDTAATEIDYTNNLYSNLINVAGSSSTYIINLLKSKANLVNGIVPLNELPTATTSTIGVVSLVDSYTSTSTYAAPTANALNQLYVVSSSSFSTKADLVGGIIPISQLPLASTTTIGVVQLDNTYTSTLTNTAPTAYAVNALYNYLNSVFVNKADLVNGVIPPNELPIATTTVSGVALLLDSTVSTSTTTVPIANNVKQVYDMTTSSLASKADLVNGVVPLSQLPVATTSSAGMVSLTNDYISTSMTSAPTANAVNQLYSLINSLSTQTLYALDIGTVNAYSALYTPTVTSVVDGLVLKFKALNTNTGPSTFSPNGISTATILSKTHRPLYAGEITANGDVWIQWNASVSGGSWILIESTGVLPTERVYTTTSAALSILNGSIQSLTLVSNDTLSFDLINGQKMTVKLLMNGFTLDTSNVVMPIGFTSFDANDYTMLLAVNVFGVTFVVISGVVTSQIYGGMWLWGFNGAGQLGDGTRISRSSPAQTISGGTNWTTISVGSGNVGAIRTDGTLWVWGNNSYGQLGDGTTVNKSSPVQTIAGGNNWKSISFGSGHGGAIKSDGTLWVWGQNWTNQLGDGTTVAKSSPVQTIAGGNNWKKISCSGFNTAATKTDGTVWAWGNNTYGQLGNGTTLTASIPIQILSGSQWNLVVCGGNVMCGIKTDGTLWTWGQNNYGQLGDGTTVNKSSPVQTIAGGNNWTSVSVNGDSVGAIKADGTLWTWGWNFYGQLGDGTNVNKSSPVQTIAGGNNWQIVSAAGGSTAAIKSDGSLWVWGYNDTGELGDGTTVAKSSPVQTIAGGNNWKKISGGGGGNIAAIR